MSRRVEESFEFWRRERQVGRLDSASFANFDSYANCAYWTDKRGGSGMAKGGAVVADLSDPTRPDVAART